MERNIYDPVHPKAPEGLQNLQDLQAINRARWFNFLKARIGNIYEFKSNKLGLIKITVVDVFNGDDNIAYVSIKNQFDNIKNMPIDEFVGMLNNKII